MSLSYVSRRVRVCAHRYTGNSVNIPPEMRHVNIENDSSITARDIFGNFSHFTAGDWIVKFNDGKVACCRDEIFYSLFEQQE